MNDAHVVIPRGHGYNLVCLQMHVSLTTGGILGKDDIHDLEELLNALVLPQIFTPLHKERVLSFIMASDDDAFRFSERCHYFYL